jgi:hypothetical protein
MKSIRPLRWLCATLLLAALPACTATAPKLAGRYDSPAHRPQNPGAVRVKVSLQNQAIYVMEGNRPLLVTATTVGTPQKPTPRGNFRVYKKIRDKRSYSYGFWVRGNDIVAGTSGQRPGGGGWSYVGYPMAYWCEFLPAYGFHEGFVWPVPRTHGCLRLHKNVAPKFFALVQNGTPVSIATTQPEDATLGRNLARPQDYRDPDPPASLMISSRVFQPPTGPLFVN